MSDPLQIKPAVARGRMREELWDDPNWVAEEKLDGVRYLWHIHEGHSHFTSRRISNKTGRYVQKDEHFPHLQEWGKLLPPGTILDGEVMPPLGMGGKAYNVISITGSSPQLALHKQESEGWLRFVGFDCLFYGGVDLQHRPLNERQLRMYHTLEPLRNHPSVSTPTSSHPRKREFFNSVWEGGGEGVILKHLDAPYGDPLAWVKVKISETYDVVITGYKPATEVSLKVNGELSQTKFAERGWIGAIMFDLGGVTGFCSGMDEETRQYISEHQKECIGRVVEVRAQERLPSGALRHPRFVRFKDDKTMED